MRLSSGVSAALVPGTIVVAALSIAMGAQVVAGAASPSVTTDAISTTNAVGAEPASGWAASYPSQARFVYSARTDQLPLSDTLGMKPPFAGVAEVIDAAIPNPGSGRLKLAATGQAAKLLRPKPDPRPVVMPISGAGLVSGFGALGSMWAVAHSGLDFTAAAGTPAVAVVSGTIRAVFMHPAYGWVVELRRFDGISFWYCHLSRALVDPGQRVSQGDSVALTGATGNVTGPHLHFEVRVDGVPTDPGDFLYSHPGVPGPAPRWAVAYQQEPPPGFSILGWPEPKQKPKKKEKEKKEGGKKPDRDSGSDGSESGRPQTRPPGLVKPSPTPSATDPPEADSQEDIAEIPSKPSAPSSPVPPPAADH